MKGDKNMEHPLNETYKTPLTAELFAENFHYPPAFVHLAIDCGLEAPGGKITAVAFCNWFVIHYNDFRRMAGLPPLEVPTDTMKAEERESAIVCNILKTHADYFASRCSSLEFKEAWMNLSDEFAFWEMMY
jgi:hypothetical protein